MSSVLDEPAPAAVGPGPVEARIAASPAWLADRRRAAWDAYQAMPFPSSLHDEDWRRTDVSKLDPSEFAPVDGVEEGFIELLRAHRDGAVPEAVFAVDAPGAPDVADRNPLTQHGVLVTSLDEAARSHPELVQRALAHASTSESKFIALWNALWRGGVFVHVPAGVTAPAPLWVAHPATGSSRAVFPATVAVLEQGASLSLVDVFASPAGDAALLSDSVTTLVLGPGARLDYHMLQQWGEGVWHIALHRAVLARDARLRFFGASLGARLQKAYWETVLDGIGAEADLWGVCFGDGTQHLDHQSLQAHRQAETRSNLLLKVAVRDRARSVYSGLIDVEPAAVHADGYVQNRNLLLSQGAKADSVPRLEIRANDVRCGHGATAGHVDQDQLFYLTSRGVPRAEAEALIVRAFFDDAVQRAPLAGFGALVSGLLEAEISGVPQAGVVPG